uniref:CUB domain-containing protein n=1 Tax=Globodera rostochiensis TaxID=31243 RepID=A0A914HBD7_GLORO
MPGYGADCGGLLELTDAWTHIASPNYPEQFREGQECSWLLVAPAKQRVQLNFFGEFEMYCKVRHSLCMDYVEIRNSTDFANTGMRYCCNGTPEAPVLSDTRDMLVLFRSFYRGGRGFQARARAIGAADGQPGDWSEWSACSASCGACGVRRRVRECVPRGDAVCLTELSQTEVCARQPCASLCARTVSEEAPCEGLLSLLKGLRCRTERTRMEPCRRMCCAGYTLRRAADESEEEGEEDSADGATEREEICAK